jgi:ubiquinone/menaquinone biosynthesis C-methylase UbiE
VSAARSHPIFARLWKLASDGEAVQRAREELVRGLHGRGLEVGAGDGRSFKHYPSSVTELVAVEPEPYLRRRAELAAVHAPVPVKVLAGSAERLPAAAAEFDFAVASLVLCSVVDQSRALVELRRVLRPGAELRFFEHVRAERAPVAQAQRLLDNSGLWPRLGAGCHLSRDTLGAITAAGFQLQGVHAAQLGILARPVPFLVGRALAP